MKRLFTGCAAAALLWPAVAMAQDDDYGDVVEECYLTFGSPDEDVVTVFDQRRSANDRPESVDIVAEPDLRALVHPAEVINTVAGVNIHRGSGQESLTAIRSPVLVGGAGAGSFLYLENGIALRAPGFANVNGLFEANTELANTVEVFKGPGPAEFGSNALHGLVNVVTPQPGDGSRVTVLGSSRGYGRVSAGVDVTENLRASLSLAHDDGFRDDSGFDQQKAELRYKTYVGDWNVDAIAGFNNLNQETAGFLQGADAYRDLELTRTNAFPEAFRDGRNYRAQVNLSTETELGELRLTPYARRAELRFLRHFVPGQALEKNDHTSFGLQTALVGDDWSVGVDGELTDGRLYEFQSNPSRFSFVQGLHFDYEVEALTLAGYAQKTFRTGELTIDLGARGEYTRYDYDTLAPAGRSGRFTRAPDRVDDFFTLTPKLGLTYAASDRVTLFARAARGSRAPQTTDLYAVVQNQEPGEADVETLDSVEGGVRFIAGTMRFEVTGYHQRKDNFFFRNSAGFNVVDGKTQHTGVELSAAAPLTDWLRFSGEWSVSDQTYAFDDAPSGIIDGNEIDTAPTTLGTARLEADFDPVTLGLEWRHVGAYFTNGANTRSYPGHDIFVARAGYGVSDAVRLFGRVDNLFDTRYADRADFAFGNERYFPGRPRTVFVGVSAGF